jgi:hypothetical protein
VISGINVHPHDSIEGNPEQLILLLTRELDHEERETKVRERLPGPDVIHLSFNQITVLDVRMGFQNPLRQLQKESNVFATFTVNSS